VKQHFNSIGGKVKLRRRIILLFGVIGVAIVFLFVQLSYPSDWLAPFINIDGMYLGGLQKDEAIRQLDDAYLIKTIPLYFNKTGMAYRSPELPDFGLIISNGSRINKINYPWYLRIIPTSILWAQFFTVPSDEPTYQRNNETLAKYIYEKFGPSCKVEPMGASLEAYGTTLSVIPSQSGGNCSVSNMCQILSSIKPRLNRDSRVNIPITNLIVPKISDEAARKLGNRLQKKAGTGVVININTKVISQTIPTSDLFSWLDFDQSGDKLKYSFNKGRASVYLDRKIAPQLALVAGTTIITTYNLNETARSEGNSGEKLDVSATLGSLKSFLDDDKQAKALVESVAPKIIYKRSYSSTNDGLSAMMQDYAQEHEGAIGVSMTELSGQYRHAAYNDTKLFTTASTYKLFVAYVTLKRIEEGVLHWSDEISGGRSLSVCFDDMVTKSDNACGAALFSIIGSEVITDEVHAIGCIDTSFGGSEGVKTTPADLALVLVKLQAGQLLMQQSTRDYWINTMKQNTFRQGIPTGLKGITVADKIGSNSNLLHDAAIVYSPTGTYVLVIMTDGAGWSTIADLASKVEALRNQ
jgi:beta-lactamase class A